MFGHGDVTRGLRVERLCNNAFRAPTLGQTRLRGGRPGPARVPAATASCPVPREWSPGRGGDSESSPLPALVPAPLCVPSKPHGEALPGTGSGLEKESYPCSLSNPGLSEIYGPAPTPAGRPETTGQGEKRLRDRRSEEALGTVTGLLV